MILVDANLLIYAIDSDAPDHKIARRWLEKTLSSAARVGLPWIVLLAFIRITTRQEIVRKPLSADDALSYVEEWLQQPYVSTVSPGPNHWPILRNLISRTGTAGNLTSDAHIAALAIEYGYTIYSADYDFNRFPGVSHLNPLVS
ncbi:type II toxin-antitoxin system VapC family toxin [Acidobacteria bacterium AH-259-A15]|nr:type II toxin-antitoxin system VapC family toxin [Acidobacteria bacterium AH-259-A15]